MPLNKVSLYSTLLLFHKDGFGIKYPTKADMSFMEGRKKEGQLGRPMYPLKELEKKPKILCGWDLKNMFHLI